MSGLVSAYRGMPIKTHCKHDYAVVEVFNKETIWCNFVVNNILIKLTRLHNEGLSFRAINTAKPMLSTMFEVIHKIDIGRNILVKRFMRVSIILNLFCLKHYLLGM